MVQYIKYHKLFCIGDSYEPFFPASVRPSTYGLAIVGLPRCAQKQLKYRIRFS